MLSISLAVSPCAESILAGHIPSKFFPHRSGRIATTTFLVISQRDILGHWVVLVPSPDFLPLTGSHLSLLAHRSLGVPSTGIVPDQQAVKRLPWCQLIVAMLPVLVFRDMVSASQYNMENYRCYGRVTYRIVS